MVSMRLKIFHPVNKSQAIKNPQNLPDGESGGKEEKLMLGLRLSQGVNLEKI